MEDPHALGLLMKRLAGRQTRYVNRQESRRGTLWESRYKSSPIQTDAYFLACCRYVELNPVRARMVASPVAYPWSSYRTRLSSGANELLDTHSCFQALGESTGDRCLSYEEFVHEAIPDGEWDLIRRSVQRGQLTGNDYFIDEVEKMIGRRVEHRAPGNQPKDSSPK